MKKFIKKSWAWVLGVFAFLAAIFLVKSSKNEELLAEKSKNKKLDDLNKNIRKMESEGKKKVFDKFADKSEDIQKKTVELRDQIQKEELERLDSIKSAEDATEAIKRKLGK